LVTFQRESCLDGQRPLAAEEINGFQGCMLACLQGRTFTSPVIMQHDDPDERLDKRTKTTIERLFRNKQSEGGQLSAWTTLSSLSLSLSVDWVSTPWGIFCRVLQPGTVCLGVHTGWIDGPRPRFQFVYRGY
jgi:hypothetical protein